MSPLDELSDVGEPPSIGLDADHRGVASGGAGSIGLGVNGDARVKYSAECWNQ